MWICHIEYLATVDHEEFCDKLGAHPDHVLTEADKELVARSAAVKSLLVVQCRRISTPTPLQTNGKGLIAYITQFTTFRPIITHTVLTLTLVTPSMFFTPYIPGPLAVVPHFDDLRQPWSRIVELHGMIKLIVIEGHITRVFIASVIHEVECSGQHF